MPKLTTIVFDTDCVLCSGMVHFILRHERAPSIRFVGAWSDTGLRLAADHGLSRTDLDETYLVIENGHSFTKSDAGLVVVRHLNAPWSWLGILRIIPKPLRDALYTLIARRRYRWFGHKSQCFRPPMEAVDRFVDT
ncbi:MAG: DCC1-like thiol-disulfide oxidoreductase family protein [Hyphomicrobiaceae bacterium]